MSGSRICSDARPAPGFEDTEFGAFMEPGGRSGWLKVTGEFKLEAVKLVKERG